MAGAANSSTRPANTPLIPLGNFAWHRVYTFIAVASPFVTGIRSLIPMVAMNRKVWIVSPPDLSNSGLRSYAIALQEALSRPGVKPIHLSGLAKVWGQLTQDPSAIFWCGIPADYSAATATIDAILAMPASIPQILFPEWESHSVADLAGLLRRAISKRLLIAYPNNIDVGQQVESVSAKWCGAYIPTPLGGDAFHIHGSAQNVDDETQLRAIYVGRDNATKKVAELVTAWEDVSTALRARLDIFSFTPSVAYHTLPKRGVRIFLVRPTLDPARFERYAAYHVFVSASAFEFGPIAAMEAMSQGCVPILANSPGHIHLIERSNSGFTFDNIDELRAAIRRLSDNWPEYIRLSRIAFDYVQRCHNPGEVCKAFWELVDMW